MEHSVQYTDSFDGYEDNMNKPEYIIVHHTGGTDTNPLEDTSHHTAAIIKSWHLQKGWSDIGYNWVIEKNGKTVKGRDEKKDGAHAIGYNSKSIGICLSGNFDATLPTKEQEKALASLLASIMARYSAITKDKIVPHRTFANKTCYGKLLKEDWARNLLNTPEVKPEIKDNSKDCKEYLAKQDMNGLMKFLDYLFSLIRSK